MKVIIVARVSTEDKDQNPQRQLLKCRKYCELHDHEVIAEVVDHCTGDSHPFERPEGKKIRGYLKAGAQGIVCETMDRFTRQHPTKVIRFLNELKDQGVKVISVTEPAFNMEGEFSDLLIYIMQWFNNYFLKKLSQDVKSGQERARAEGKHIGHPGRNFNERRAYKLMFHDGKSHREVAKIFMAEWEDRHGPVADYNFKKKNAAERPPSASTLYRFKSVCRKNPPSFIKELDGSKTDVYETGDENGKE